MKTYPGTLTSRKACNIIWHFAEVFYVVAPGKAPILPGLEVNHPLFPPIASCMQIFKLPVGGIKYSAVSC